LLYGGSHPSTNTKAVEGVRLYTIIVYDVGVERVNRVRKYLRTWMEWVQNSVFEGELTTSELERIKHGLSKMIDEQHDSVFIYTTRTEKLIKKYVIGVEKNVPSQII